MLNAPRAVCPLVLAAAALLAAAPGVVWAQVDLSGEWAPLFHEDQPERIPGPDIGDYLGLPINDEARQRADAWDASLLTLPEHQCKPHPADYSAHTWQGFSTGSWDGGMLTVQTTHLKAGWIRRNGVARSDTGTLTEHFIRHGDYLTHIGIITDPVYLTEPFIRTTNWVLDLRQQIAPYPCQAVTEVDRPSGVVPHHLPGTNEFLREYAARHRLPFEATRGGADTMYPEYIEKLKTM